MFKPSKAPMPGRSPAGGLAIRLVGLALCLPLVALAGVMSTDIPVPRAVASDSAPKLAGGSYRVRCWQHGRLLFEENHVTLPADSTKYGLKLTGTDRHGKPMYVAETRNATCLVRHAADERAWPR